MKAFETFFPDEYYPEGKKLIECLDKENFNYPIILWINFPDKRGWTLLFGIPGLNIIGVNDIIGNMKRIIRENEIDISTDKISVIDSFDQMCITLKSCITTGPGIINSRMSATNLNGMQIPETVIYRIN